MSSGYTALDKSKNMFYNGKKSRNILNNLNKRRIENEK